MARIIYLVSEEKTYLETQHALFELEKELDILWASSGEEAIENIAKEKFDCILCEFQLPKMNGLDFLRVLRERGNNTPVIFFTAYGSEKIAAQAFKMGASDYFIKEDGFSNYEVILKSIKKEVGNITCPFCMKNRATDISLNESRDILLSFMDNCSIMSFVKDRDLRFVYVNKAFEKAMNRTIDELKGKTNDDIFPKDVAARFNHIDRDIFKIGKPVESEGFFCSDYSYITHKFPILDSNGVPYLLGGTVVDITARKKMEEALSKALLKAEDANRLKDKFVSLVAHDLRAPASSNANLLKMILTDKENRLAKEHREILELVMESCLKMRVFVDDILNISTLRSGKIEPDKRFVHINPIISNEISKFKKRADEKGITVFNEISDDLKLFVDGTFYSQVIANLFDNAIKFCNRKDQIVFFEVENEPGSIGITDTGVGIDEKMVEKLFKYDSKTSTNGTAGEIGSGLGLPFCRDIMLAHGGDITVESKPGNGTTFYLKLPHAKPLVLVVDDSKIFRIELKKILEKIEVDVIEAEDGKEAIQTLKTQKPDLIITDIKMPYLDGLELLELIKNDNETKSTPVIVVSSLQDMAIKEEVFKKGGDDFVSRELEIDDLLPRVKRFLFF